MAQGPSPQRVERKLSNTSVGNLLELLADMTMSADALLDAEVLYRRTKELYQQSGDLRCLARCSAKLAIVLAEENKLAASKIESEESLDYFGQISDLDKNKGAILHNLGWIATQQGNTDEACRRYTEAIRYYDLFKGDDLASILAAVSRRSLAKVYFQRKKYGQAAQLLKECLSTFEAKIKKNDSMTHEVRREYKECVRRAKE